MTSNHSGSSDPAVAPFIERWTATGTSERSNSQLFLTELCDLLAVPRPEPTFKNGYAFEYTVEEQGDSGDTHERRIDLYKRHCFVLESKQFQAKQEALNNVEKAVEESGVTVRKKRSGPTRGTDRYDDAMVRGRGHAERYIRALPDTEKNPPFLIVVDVGDTLELYADFSQAGRSRAQIRRSHHRNRPPPRRTCQSLEAAGHGPQKVAEFLSRCLFRVFAEDVGLLPNVVFRNSSNLLRQTAKASSKRSSSSFET